MNVTTRRKLDLAQPDHSQEIFCVQGDALSRSVVLELAADGKAWAVPEDASVLISYFRADGGCGTYDKMPDGSCAWKISQNTITIDLTPQMLTTAGPVAVQVTLICGNETISTFAFHIQVQPGLAPGNSPECYTNWLSMYLPQTSDAVQGQYLRIAQVDDTGRVTAIEGAELSFSVLKDQLEAQIKRVAQLESRVFALEENAGAIQQMGDRLSSLEENANEVRYLKVRVTALENKVGL